MTEEEYVKFHTALAVATAIFCLAMVLCCESIWIKAYFAVALVADLIATIRMLVGKIKRRRK